MQVAKGKNSCGISGQQRVERGLQRNDRSAFRQGNAAFFRPLASERSCYSWFSRIETIHFLVEVNAPLSAPPFRLIEDQWTSRRGECLSSRRFHDIYLSKYPLSE
jgi:hypothetical protein